MGRGEFNRKVRFERATILENDLGGEEADAWELVEMAWAKVLYGTGAERRQAAVDGATQTATFRVLSTNALRGVTIKNRIVDDAGVEWNIVSIAPIGVNKEIEFTARTDKG
jgi:head-tail adaptor